LIRERSKDEESYEMMNLRAVSSAGRVASPRHRRTRLLGDTGEILVLSLRLAAVGLLSTVGWIHLHLWQQGYRHIPTIGPLFLIGAVSALIIGTVLLARPSRLIGLLGFGLNAGILAGLILSVNIGLFGFRESLSVPFAVESVVLEIAAAVTLAAWIAADLIEESRHIERAARVADTPASTTVRVRTID
jgi:hypothetical protein